MNLKLLVISSDYISSWIKKGEVITRYYNPGNIFNEVHIILTNNDNPDPLLVQQMVGDATLFIYNYPEPRKFFKSTLGWMPFLMKKWARKLVDLTQMINPNIVRCHGLQLNAFLAAEIKRKLKIPFVISLHGNPDIDYLRGRLALTLKDKFLGMCYERLERYCLKYVDHVIAVYSPIIPYLKKHRVKSFSMIYNVVALNAEPKKDYSLSDDKFKLLCVGRQTWLQKDPSNIIRAVSQIPKAYLTIIGDGDLHTGLVELSQKLKCDHRVQFIKTLNNKEILKFMNESDLYVYHSINYEISKSCIESALVGLPVILNDRLGDPAEELVDAGFLLVEDTPEGYAKAILDIMLNDDKREGIAKASQMYAHQHWDPTSMENKLIELYKAYLPT